MNIILKKATIIDPESPFHLQIADVQIQDNRIIAIEKNIVDSDFTEVERENLHLSPGWMDSSVCLGEPGYEERETLQNGIAVASKSGFTHIAIQPNTQPVTDTQSIVGFILQKAVGAATEVFPIGALTKKSEGLDMAELYDMQNAGALAFGDYNKSQKNSNLLKIALQYTQDFDALVLAYSLDQDIKGSGVVHEGDASIKLGLKGIPALAEDLQIARNIYILEYTGGKMHIPTVSTKNGVQLIREAKAKGLAITCSVAAHHLVLTDAVLGGFDTRFKVSPPLRDEAHRQALLTAVIDGTIDCITSDHNPLDIEHKKLEFDHASNGTVGLESIFGALMTVLPLEVVIQKLTAAKAIFKIPTTTIAVGQTACLSLFSPEEAGVFSQEDILSKSKNAIFLNQPIKGKVYGIFNQNQLILK
ncbi:dihydroorotase [Flavobacterium sp. JP2137]|uniref:dihydroorotase n=1 Tax=Flavobacterium sp. JP2137 TaxID=3414510 RepID=UPI003D300CD9